MKTNSMHYLYWVYFANQHQDGRIKDHDVIKHIEKPSLLIPYK